MDANQNHRAAGAIVEDIALAYLEQHDYKLLARNFFSRHGEIDLIMSRQQCIVFVEVRHRLSTQYGGALESITWHKQQRLRKTALSFMTRYKAHSSACRFDVLCYSGALKLLNQDTEPLWVKNAF